MVLLPWDHMSNEPRGGGQGRPSGRCSSDGLYLDLSLTPSCQSPWHLQPVWADAARTRGGRIHRSQHLPAGSSFCTTTVLQRRGAEKKKGNRTYSGRPCRAGWRPAWEENGAESDFGQSTCAHSSNFMPCLVPPSPFQRKASKSRHLTGRQWRPRFHL